MAIMVRPPFLSIAEFMTKLESIVIQPYMSRFMDMLMATRRDRNDVYVISGKFPFKSYSRLAGWEIESVGENPDFDW